MKTSSLFAPDRCCFREKREVADNAPPSVASGLSVIVIICGCPLRLLDVTLVYGPRIVYDKFHVLQHANKAIDEVRRAEFFRKGGRMRGVVKGKRWLLLTRWTNLDSQKRQQLNDLFALNRRVMKAYLLKESLERLWTYR